MRKPEQKFRFVVTSKQRQLPEGIFYGKFCGHG